MTAPIPNVVADYIAPFTEASIKSRIQAAWDDPKTDAGTKLDTLFALRQGIQTAYETRLNRPLVALTKTQVLKIQLAYLVTICYFLRTICELEADAPGGKRTIRTYVTRALADDYVRSAQDSFVGKLLEFIKAMGKQLNQHDRRLINYVTAIATE